MLAILIFTVLCFSECKKHKPETPVEQLPPVTQSGKNTLGFLLNGQPWTPKGWSGGTTNLSVYYDQTFRGGTFNITTYRQISQDDKQTFGIAMDSLQKIGTYNSENISNLKFAFIDAIKNCQIDYFDASIFRKSKLIITKLDKTNQIISGTFDVVLYKTGCGDTLKITEGRFDMKY